MTTLDSRLDTTSEDFTANVAAMTEMWTEVESALQTVPEIGGARYIERHRKRGKLLVRERIELLIDPGTAFLELSPLAGWGTDDPLGGGMVAGIGIIEGTKVAISASDMTVRGGSSSATTVRKVARLHEIVRENRLPLVMLNESAGADLTAQADIFTPGGEQFRNLTQFSEAGIPTIAVGLGPATAGGAYLLGMSDYVVMVDSQATAYLGGPPLVQMAIDEVVDEETLGGASMHARTSGLADYLARDDRDALRITREIVRHLEWDGTTRADGPARRLRADVRAPLHPASELMGCASADLRIPFDVREILARVLDGSEFEEFKALYGDKLVCGWGSIFGQRVGIIANNGILFGDESEKGAQFIQLCNVRGIPLVFIQNITGFMVGSKAEQDGIIRKGSKLINAVANSKVPHVVLMVGASYGAGNYGMSGKPYRPRFIFSWPNHRLAVMGARQLAGVLDIVSRNAAAGRGVEVDEEELEKRKSALENQVDHESLALYVTGRVWDDGIINPADTRTVLGLALTVCADSGPTSRPNYGIWRH